MLYNFRFAAAVREICSLQSEGMVAASKSLPVRPDQLATALATNKPDVWRSRGLSPRHAAIMTIASVIEKSKHEPAAPGISPFLCLALASHAIRNPADAELIATALECGEDATLMEPLSESDTSNTQGRGGQNHAAIAERVRDRMGLVHGMWKIMTGPAVEAMTPSWFAIVFGMMDSVGQSFDVDRQTTAEAMKAVLEDSEYILCMAAGRDPAMRSWVMAGGQAVYEMATDKDKSATDVLATLARRHLAHVKSGPDV